MSHPVHEHAKSLGPGLTCREAIDFIMAYLDNELPASERHEFERHLSVCPSCVHYLDSYRRTVQLGRAAMGVQGDEPAAGKVPEGLLNAIRAARKRAS